jgi:hypothetical protein
MNKYKLKTIYCHFADICIAFKEVWMQCDFKKEVYPTSKKRQPVKLQTSLLNVQRNCPLAKVNRYKITKKLNNFVEEIRFK